MLLPILFLIRFAHFLWLVVVLFANQKNLHEKKEKKVMKKMNKKGFTIVELVIVIAVIAILAAVMIPTFGGIIERANKSSAEQTAKALWKELYGVDLSDGKLDGETVTVPTSDDYTVTYEADEDGVVTFTYTDDDYEFTWDSESNEWN